MYEIKVPHEEVKDTKMQNEQKTEEVCRAKLCSEDKLENAEIILKMTAVVLILPVLILKLIQVGAIAQIVLISLICILLLASLVINMKMKEGIFTSCAWLFIWSGNLFLTIATL